MCVNSASTVLRGAADNFSMVEILWHRRETRRQTENTNIDLQLGEDAVYSTNSSFQHNTSASGFTATHAAVSIDRSRAEIRTVASDNGWKALELSRGSFNVIEFWIENRVLIELLTPDMVRDYLAATKKFVQP